MDLNRKSRNPSPMYTLDDGDYAEEEDDDLEGSVFEQEEEEESDLEGPVFEQEEEEEKDLEGSVFEQEVEGKAARKRQRKTTIMMKWSW